jgi:hypothetical protein
MRRAVIAMKHTFLASIVALALLLSGIALAASTYEVTRSSVSSGGAVSTGGRYRLGGSAGQMDAGQLAGGSYTLGGGFWGGSGVAAQNGYIRYLPLIAR